MSQENMKFSHEGGRYGQYFSCGLPIGIKFENIFCIVVQKVWVVRVQAFLNFPSP